jgi:hypothetical protein
MKDDENVGNPIHEKIEEMLCQVIQDRVKEINDEEETARKDNKEYFDELTNNDEKEFSLLERILIISDEAEDKSSQEIQLDLLKNGYDESVYSIQRFLDEFNK